MKLNLSRPICVFDLEATGSHPVRDRIVKLVVSKLLPGGKRIGTHTLINPGKPITEEATADHGITDEMVKDAPTFREISQSLMEFISGSDFLGFNWYSPQVSMLVQEFHRVGFPNPVAEVSVIDPLRIFMGKERSTLTALFKFYCGEELEETGSPHNKTDAIIRVLLGQLERYNDIPNNIQHISAFSHGDEFVDYREFLRYRNGGYIHNWGGRKGNPVVEEIHTTVLLHAQIPEETKVHLRRILGREEPEDDD